MPVPLIDHGEIEQGGLQQIRLPLAGGAGTGGQARCSQKMRCERGAEVVVAGSGNLGERCGVEFTSKSKSVA